jgi:hypothetical protein
MLSQVLGLLKSWTSGKIVGIEMGLKLFGVQTNISFCESEP